MLGEAGPALEDVLVLRVLATSLGVRQASGQVAFLLPRNATIPTKREVSARAPCMYMGPTSCRSDNLTKPMPVRRHCSSPAQAEHSASYTLCSSGRSHFELRTRVPRLFRTVQQCARLGAAVQQGLS